MPLPADAPTLAESAALGRQLFALFDVQTPVSGVTQPPVRPEIRAIGAITRADGQPLDPERDLALTAGWGFAGQGGVTMAGKGRAVRRAYTTAERDALRTGTEARGLPLDEVYALLGIETYDIWLNEGAYWRNVPVRVWEYTIGGYQVLKKWLSYREHELLRRSLTSEEAREVSGIVQRIAAILLLGPDLDTQYQAVKAALHTWPGLPT